MIPNTVVTFTPVEGEAGDVSCDVADVSINHGRSDPGAQPEASTATVSMPFGLTAGVEIGATMRVVSGATSVRFVGTVTDMATEWEPRVVGGEVTVIPVAVVVAAGPLADAGRRYVGDAPWPQELDGDRIARIIADAVPPESTGTVDPGTVAILPRDVDRQAALGLMQDVAKDAAGVLWETRDGLVSYADAMARHGIPITCALDSCDVLMSPRWTRTRSGLVNDIAVTYGVDAGGARPVVTLASPGSIASYGRMAYSVTTELAELADATAMAELLMARNSSPAWLLDGIGLDLFILDAATTAEVLSLDVHSLMSITNFPAGGPETEATLWVEGWTENIALDQHRLSLFVSSYCRTAPPPLWDDVPSAWLWDHGPPSTLTWDEATCIGPIPPQGRWADVPARIRWNAVAPTVTWDTWEGMA